MDDNYVEIVMFDSFGEANETIEILNQHHIHYQLKDIVVGAGPLLSSATGEHQIRLSVKQEDAARARELLSLTTEADDSQLRQTLVNLSNEELLDVVSSNGEWGAAMVAEAKDLLEKRGFTEFWKAEGMRESKIIKRRMGEKAGRRWVAVGFLCALVAGPLGFLMGYFLATLKEKDADGNKFYVYDHDSRQAGWVMLAIGIVSFVFIVWGGWFNGTFNIYNW